MIDTASETWGAVLAAIRDAEAVAQEAVNSPETPDNLTNYNRGILALAKEIASLPGRKAPAIERRTA